MAFRLFCIDNEEIYQDFGIEATLGRKFVIGMYIRSSGTPPDFNFVSRRHINIYNGPGEFGIGYYLKNLGKNGTCIDGTNLKKDELWKLCEGNIIRFGNSEMNFAPAFLFREIK